MGQGDTLADIDREVRPVNGDTIGRDGLTGQLSFQGVDDDPILNIGIIANEERLPLVCAHRRPGGHHHIAAQSYRTDHRGKGMHIGRLIDCREDTPSREVGANVAFNHGWFLHVAQATFTSDNQQLSNLARLSRIGAMNELRQAVNDHWRARADLAPMRRLLEERGHEPGAVPPAALASFDQLHVGQNSGTRRFLDWVSPVKGDHVLDLGAGLGGTARVLAADFGCRVEAVDCSPELTETARELTRWTGQTERVGHRCEEITGLESIGEFDIAMLQHVDMQVADKGALYRAATRNLGRGARIVWHDWLAGSQGPPRYPVPWSTDGRLSHPATSASFEAALKDAGLELTRFEEMARPTVDWLTATIYRMDTFLGRKQSANSRRFRELEAQRIAHARLRENVIEGKLLPFFGEAATIR